MSEMTLRRPERRVRKTRIRMHDRRTPATANFTADGPSWPDQRMQYVVRYLFGLFALAYFQNMPGDGYFPLHLSTHLGLILSYLAINTGNYLWVRGNQGSVAMCRYTLWLDLLFLSLCLVNDPFPLPPSLLCFVLVTLGNGMRFGSGFYFEAVVGSIVGAGVALMVRHSIVGIPVPPGLPYLCVFSAVIVLYCYALVQRIERTHAQLAQLARRDPLTGLLNRRGLSESIEMAFSLLNRDEGGLSLMFADLDNFKAVNDRLGHLRGDKVLQEVSRVLVTGVRRGDRAARYGGDEFVLVLPNAATKNAPEIAARMTEEIEEIAREVGVDFGVSFGYLEISPEGFDLESVLEQLDVRLYEAKRCSDSAIVPSHPSLAAAGPFATEF